MEALITLALIALYIGGTVFWILMLINSAKTEQWGWFVGILVFGLIALPYRFVAYRSPAEIAERKRRRRKTQDARTRKRDDRIRQLEEEVDHLKKENR